MCRGYEADPHRCEDLRQEVLLQLWRALGSFRGDASLRTFVFRVAHNTAIKHVTKAVRAGPTVGLEERDVPVAPPAHEADLDRHRARQRLLARVQALPVLDRELVLLHLEGLANTEIAQVMGVSASNVGTRLHRLKGTLARAVGGMHAA